MTKERKQKTKTQLIAKRLGRKAKGFTLLELLLVIAIIAVLAGIIMFSLKPSDRLVEANTQKVKSDVGSIYKSIQAYTIENGGTYPNTIYEYDPLTMPNPQKDGCVRCRICKTGGSCGGITDLVSIIPTYLQNIPQIPGIADANWSGYSIYKNKTTNELSVWGTYGGEVIGNGVEGIMKVTSLLTGTSINDVFYYDTTKDTNYRDGSANDPLVWRFNSARSWYTETIDNPYTTCNISTDDRCGIQAFPEKSYIVATNSNVYIIDATENAMWMRFDRLGNMGQNNVGILSTSGGSSNIPNSVYSLNGRLYIGRLDINYGGVSVVNFVSDTAWAYKNHNAGVAGLFNGNITQRNSGLGYAYGYGFEEPATHRIVQSSVNDIYASVISGKTYLAVATDGGVSVMNETDGTVVNFINAYPAGYYGYVKQVSMANGDLYAVFGNVDIPLALYGWYDFVTLWPSGINFNITNTAASYYSARYDNGNYGRTVVLTPNNGAGFEYSRIKSLQVTSGTSTLNGQSNTIYLGFGYYNSWSGATIVQENQSNYLKSSVKYITKDYVSEEMIGDIKGMWGMATKNGGTAVGASVSNNETIDDYSVRDTDMTVVADAGGIATTAGVRGKALTFDGTNDYLKQKVYLTGTQTARVDTAGSAAITITGLATYTTVAQPYSYMIVSTNCSTVGWGYLGAVITGDNLKVFNTKTGTTQNWVTLPSGGICDSFEIKKTDFQVSGVSSLSLGGWVKINSVSWNSLIKKPGGLYDTYSLTIRGDNNKARLQTGRNSGEPVASELDSNTILSQGVWYFITAVYNGTNTLIYINGNLDNVGTIPSGINDTQYSLVIGSSLNGTLDEPFITAEALTAGQIKRMYDIGLKSKEVQGTSGINGTSNQINTVVGLDVNNIYLGSQGGGVSKLGLASDTLLDWYTTTTIPAILNDNVTSISLGNGGIVVGTTGGLSIVSNVGSN